MHRPFSLVPRDLGESGAQLKQQLQLRSCHIELLQHVRCFLRASTAVRRQVLRLRFGGNTELTFPWRRGVALVGGRAEFQSKDCRIQLIKLL